MAIKDLISSVNKIGLIISLLLFCLSLLPSTIQAAYCGGGTWSCCIGTHTSCYDPNFNTCDPAFDNPCNCYVSCSSEASDSCANSCPSEYGCIQDVLAVYLGCPGPGSYSSPPGGYDTPPVGYDTPYPVPYNYPYPVPADLTPVSFYLKDADNNKTYNFAENEDIFWYTQIKNIGDELPDASHGVNVYANLYKDQVSTFNAADTSRTPTYIRNPRDTFVADATLTFDSRAAGARTAAFLGPNSFSFGAGDGKPITARIFVDPLNQYPEEANNYSNNQATFRYTVGPPADLTVEEFHLINGAGTTRTAFDLSENIFPYVRIRNEGGSTAFSIDPDDKHNYTWFYLNEPSNVPTNTTGDTGVRIQGGELSKGSSSTYYCKPDPGANCDDFISQQAWDSSTKGVYTGRVFTNFDRNVIEGDYGNNQATIEYSVGYTISGRIYADMNKSNSYNSGVDFNLAGITVTFTGPDDSGTAVTESNGTYTSPALEPGTYAITTNVSSDYAPTTTYPRSANFTSRADLTGQDIRYFPTRTISGRVFVDDDSSREKNGSEVDYAANPGIVVSTIPGGAPTPPAVTNNTDGTYTVTGLISGTYTIQYPNLPSGYVMTWPRNTNPPSFSARVGTNCAEATPNPGGNCVGNNLENVNFGIKGGQPWFQALGLDVRMDNGFYDPVPPSPASACGGAYALLPASSTTPGMAFSGSTPANVWLGQVSSTNWAVGDSSYAEVYPPSNSTKTSYAYLLSVAQASNITLQNLADRCSINNCTLPSSLTSGVVYQANGDVFLNGYTFPANRNFVILVNGDLTIKGQIRVPTTSTVIFSAAGSIYVQPGVGQTTPVCPAPAVGSGDLEGFYSADEGFTIQSGKDVQPPTTDCTATPPVPDRQLNVQGAIVVNAGGAGGAFSNDRDLCTNNINYPSMTIRERPDFIIHAPDFIKSPSYIWQEVAP